MTAIRHVAVLALHAGASEAARLPLPVRVLEQLAVQRDAVRLELMAAATELRAKKCRRSRHSVVRQRGAWPGALNTAIAAWWTESLVASHVACGARDAPVSERGVEHPAFLVALPAADERSLLGQRRVARIADDRRRRIALRHLDELAGDAGAQCARVQARPPVRKLRGMTGAARFRSERLFEPTEARRRRALRRERLPPVLRDEVVRGVGDGTRGREHAERGNKRDEKV